MQVPYAFLTLLGDYLTYNVDFQETYFCSRAGGRPLYQPHLARLGCGMGAAGVREAWAQAWVHATQVRKLHLSSHTTETDRQITNLQ